MFKRVDVPVKPSNYRVGLPSGSVPGVCANEGLGKAVESWISFDPIYAEPTATSCRRPWMDSSSRGSILARFSLYHATTGGSPCSSRV
jgi:hypothetical protein